MADILAALVPIFAVILLGFFLRRFGFPGDGFWPQAERLTYYVLFPALLVGSLSRGGFGGQPVWPLAATLAGSVLSVSLLLTVLRPRMAMGGPAYSSVFQSSIRPNTYVGLSAAWALLGTEGVGLSAIALLTLIPMVNVLAVSVLARHGAALAAASAEAPRTADAAVEAAGPRITDAAAEAAGPRKADAVHRGSAADGHGRAASSALPGAAQKDVRVGRILRELAKNPLILGCVVGICLNAFALRLPHVVSETLNVLGRAALPLGLLAVGAGLRMEAVRANMGAVALGSCMKLALLPCVALALSPALGLGHDERLVAVIFTAIPVSASSFILARQMGGDHGLMAGLITAQTAMAAVTLPIVLSMVAG